MAVKKGKSDYFFKKSSTLKTRLNLNLLNERKLKKLAFSRQRNNKKNKNKQVNLHGEKNDHSKIMEQSIKNMQSSKEEYA